MTDDIFKIKLNNFKNRMENTSPIRFSSMQNIRNKNEDLMKITKMKQFEEYFKELLKMKREFFIRYSNEHNCQSEKMKTLSDFKLTSILGRGASSVVVLAKFKANNAYYALKIINKEKYLKNSIYSRLQNEKQILCSVKFPFLISMDCSFTESSNMFFVLPYIPGGDLFTLLKRHGKFKEKDVKFYAAQIILALEYLHFLDIIHRDLKPENIILDIYGYLKLSDFGFCKLVKTRTYTFCGTPEYIAPEIIVSNGYGKSADWWSFGVLLFEMIAGYTPFFDTKNLKIFENIITGKFKFPAVISSDARDLISNTLRLDRTRRYGILKNGVLDIKTHDWFKFLDWNAIYNKTAVAPYIPNVNPPEDKSIFEQFRLSTLKTLRNENLTNKSLDFLFKE